MKKILFFCLLFFTVGCSTPKSVKKDPEFYNVEYRVWSKVGDYADVTYSGETGGTNQEEAFTPWSKKIKVKPRSHLYLSAQAGKAGHKLKIRIKVNGKVLQKAECDGSYAIATVSGFPEDAPK